MRTLKELVIAGLIVWASMHAMGCTGLIMDKQIAYQTIKQGVN